MPTPVDLEMTLPSETTPLLQSGSTAAAAAAAATQAPPHEKSHRQELYDFLEAKTPAGRIYERFIIVLILINVVAFCASTLFVEEYNDTPWANRKSGLCQKLCDALWFGNYRDNGLDDLLHLGSTSVLEIFTVGVFSVEYVLRLYIADLESNKYQGFWGRLRYVPTFFSLVDLASTLPFYVDAFFLRNTDLNSSAFLRMFRLLRMMRVEGRYDTALTMVDDVYQQQKGILFTAAFVGVTTWLTVSSLYYLAERRNLDMIYCPTCSDNDDLDTSLCFIDSWGVVNCTDAGCPATDENTRPCYNLYESIPMASYYALLNLFGEFPLMEQHSIGGKIVGTLTAVVAVAVFALPVGIIGNGFEDVIAQRRQREGSITLHENGAIVEQGGMTPGFRANEGTFRGKLYNLLNPSFDSTRSGSTTTSVNGLVVTTSTTAAVALDRFINILIVATAFSFMLDTTELISSRVRLLLDTFELISVTIFTVEYGLRTYAAKEDPKYQGPGGLWAYMTTFLAMVDLLSFVPFWLQVFFTGQVVGFTTDASSSSLSSSSSTWSNIVKSLRLLRILRFERYTHAFLSFDDVISRNLDVLTVTAFTALLFWVFFSAFLYLSERNSPDPEMAANYKTVPHSMWVTLLNLSGESPLSQYSASGKVVTGILGLFATGIFGIPIGVLGAGFEEVVEEENEDNQEELESDENLSSRLEDGVGTPLERSVFAFVNGIGSGPAVIFEITVYIMIFLAVGVGIWQTVDGHENDFSTVEWVAVLFFTVEYLFRLIGAGADPLFSPGRNALTCRLRFLVSFYSIIDLFAIVPFYIALALPNSIVNQYDEYLRMLRIIRLVKLDKWIPSITLIDDVVRLKFNALRVAFYAAMTLWVLFASLLFLCEHKDYRNDMDPVPDYGCDENCTMSDRFQTFFDSMVYTGIHLTGDYPIITYTWPARIVNFFMVIAAVGVVSIPSGLIASGFVEIVQTKNKAMRGETLPSAGRAGDDWYEVRYRQLEGVPPPPSPLGPKVDRWQNAVNVFLNGELTEGGHHKFTTFAYGARVFIFSVIIGNAIAVLAESVPTIDRAVGNDIGNFFDVFEMFSVMVFAVEYILRLFCAPKNREALYSTIIYATTFFGIVDFLSTAPWFIEQTLIATGRLNASGDSARIFRVFRIFRLLQLEDFVTAFSKLDNVFRASKDVLKATGLLALIIWVGCGALFYIFEENNSNWRQCDDSIPMRALHKNDPPGCFDFASTAACNEYYPGLCSQKAFTDMPNALFYTAVFLGGEWGVVDFTWPGRMVCLFLCVVGIALYAIPIGTLFDSFGAVLGLAGDEEEDEGEGADCQQD